MPRRRLLYVAAAATLIATSVAALPAVAGAVAAGSLPTNVLTTDVLPGLAALVPTGHLAGSTRLQIGVSLTQPVAAEQRAAQAVYTPGSAAYHHFFTPATWAQRFAVPEATYRQVAGALTAGGLRVGYLAPTRSYLLLDGSAAAVERTFHVALDTFRTASGTPFYANTTGPTVPAGVTAVLDLQDLVQFQAADRAYAAGQGGCIGTAVCVGALTARDLWSVYDQPASNLGQGQRMAIIGAGSLAQPVADLRIFERLYHLPQVPVREVLVDNAADYTAGEPEWALDSEASTGMAPGVDQLDYYFGESLATGSTAAAFSAWANDPRGPLQANASFGGCESLQALLGGMTAMNPVFTQIAAEGRTQFVATGDTGGSCTVVTGNGFLNTGAPQVEYPASSPWVVAVGGTQLYTDGGAHPKRVLEKAWDYTGGGTSLYSPRQAWQAPVSAVVGRCVADGALDLTPGTPCRGLPDVAALSGDITVVPGSAVPGYGGDGYRDVEGGQSTTDGGTSLASPLWLGMWTRVQAAAPAVHGRYPGLGFAAPALYRDALSPARDARDFFDVSIGTNGQWRAEARNVTDPTGWDYVSGLGVPDVAHLMLDLTGRLTPADPLAAGAPTAVATLPTWRCGPNGVFVNHSGATTPGYADSVAMTRVTLRNTPSAITWTATVPDLVTGDQQARTFDFSFAYAGRYYETEADEGLANTGYYLYQLTFSGGVSTATTLASDLTGSFDAARHQVSVTLPVAEFNRLAKPARQLGVGAALAVLDNNSYYAYGLTGDDIAGDGCPFHLG